MRVLVVLTSTDRRGAEIEGQSLAAELAKRGEDARVVALAPGASQAGPDVAVRAPSPRRQAWLP